MVVGSLLRPQAVPPSATAAQDVYKRQDGAGAVAAGAAQAARVVGKIARLVALLLGKGLSLIHI